MPYHLFICRHAQAQNPVLNQTDYNRPLTPAGIQEAEQAGNWLQQLGIKPDLIMCSSAHRTWITACIIAKKLTYSQVDIISDKALYNASESQILNSISAINPQHTTLILVGHNPGVSDVVSSLSGHFQGNVPTGSVHHLSFEFANWQEVLVTPAKSYKSYSNAVN